VPSAIVRRPGLALDVDTPDDLARFLELARGGSTLAALRTLGVDRRVAAPVRPGA
jgi:2-phospho-L-lactate guanylyltransferase (CobY/MobA/RfbA family)